MRKQVHAQGSIDDANLRLAGPPGGFWPLAAVHIFLRRPRGAPLKFLLLSLFEAAAPKNLAGPSLISSINEARQLVDEAYKFSRNRAKEKLRNKQATPSDFLKHLKEPVAGTRTAIRAASYMEAAMELLTEKLQKTWRKHFNLTGMVLC
ncbi:hypothetical protein lerEdw1_004787 [Lerista edwardsae]|nr:hypothetical protein lerEdw1_004787 [Lerista edwardsae]